MTKIAYKTKSGLTQWKPIVSESELMSERDTGFCLACGSEAYGVEPDARRCVCDACQAPKVYGLEELCLMGLVKTTE